MLHVFSPFLITIYSYFVIFLFLFLLQVLHMFTMTFTNVIQHFSTIVFEEDDDVKFMFQINGFKLQEASNVKVSLGIVHFTTIGQQRCLISFNCTLS
jgi:hypothetical protein